jgi:cell filamentation protein
MADDPYVYPGTNVLRNHFGIRDAAELAELEAAISAGRIAQLARRFIPGDYDTAHLQAVHRKIFGDIYPWAGEFRWARLDHPHHPRKSPWQQLATTRNAQRPAGGYPCAVSRQ